MRKPTDLVGKIVRCYLLGKSRHGSYAGKVQRVTVKGGQLTTMTLRLAGRDDKGRSWRGRKVVVRPKEWTMPNMPGSVGVLWFGRLRPIEEWLEGGAA